MTTNDEGTRNDCTACGKPLLPGTPTERRCMVTGHLCGTDTTLPGGCSCASCAAHRMTVPEPDFGSCDGFAGHLRYCDACERRAAGPAPEPVKPPATSYEEFMRLLRDPSVPLPPEFSWCKKCLADDRPYLHFVSTPCPESGARRTPVAGAAPKAMSGCELVDCDRPETHTHQGRCEHPNPGDGSCDNCQQASAK